MKRHQIEFLILVLVVGIFCLYPDACYASFESSLMSMKTKVTGVILPLISVMGLALAAMSFYTGNPNAKQHIVYAIVGCCFGFGAQAIVDFISQTIR